MNSTMDAHVYAEIQVIHDLPHVLIGNDQRMAIFLIGLLFPVNRKAWKTWINLTESNRFVFAQFQCTD